MISSLYAAYTVIITEKIKASLYSVREKWIQVVNKDLSKLLGFNNKRREFDDDSLEYIEAKIGELCFRAPNCVWCDDGKSKQGPKRKRSKKQNAKQAIEANSVDENKIFETINYYNVELDKRISNQNIIIKWGLVNPDINLMHRIIMETEDEKDFVNSMKIFARFNSPEDHVNLMNSLLLEKSIREMINYVRHNPSTTIEHLSAHFQNKKLKFLSDKLIFGPLLQQDNKSLNIQSIMNFSEKHKSGRSLQGINIRPSSFYGHSELVAKANDYHNLNETERILVERYGLLPSSYLRIKQSIIETKWIHHNLSMPGADNQYNQYWKSLEGLIKIHSSNMDSFKEVGSYKLMTEIYKLVQNF